MWSIFAASLHHLQNLNSDCQYVFQLISYIIEWPQYKWKNIITAFLFSKSGSITFCMVYGFCLFVLHMIYSQLLTLLLEIVHNYTQVFHRANTYANNFVLILGGTLFSINGNYFLARVLIKSSLLRHGNSVEFFVWGRHWFHQFLMLFAILLLKMVAIAWRCIV